MELRQDVGQVARSSLQQDVPHVTAERIQQSRDDIESFSSTLVELRQDVGQVARSSLQQDVPHVTRERGLRALQRVGRLASRLASAKRGDNLGLAHRQPELRALRFQFWRDVHHTILSSTW